MLFSSFGADPGTSFFCSVGINAIKLRNRTSGDMYETSEQIHTYSGVVVYAAIVTDLDVLVCLSIVYIDQ